MPDTEARLPHLPDHAVVQILNDLASNGDQATLASFARCSRGLNEVATPILYRRLVITRRNAPRLFLGLERKAPPKERTITKKQWDADLAVFAERFDHIIRSDKSFASGFMPEDGWDDSDPETDDELAPQSVDTASTTWDRRKELLALCRHLTFLQVPSTPLVLDLVMAAGGQIRDDSVVWPDCSDTLSEDVLDDYDRLKTMLFPNVQHMALSNRFVISLSDYRRRDPIIKLLGDGLFGRPAHICFTCPPGGDTVDAERILHLIRIPVDGIQEGHVQFINDQFSYHAVEADGIAQQAVDFYPNDKLESLTVHNMRYPSERENADENEKVHGLPLLDCIDRKCIYRFFYDSHPAQVRDGTVAARAETVANMLYYTRPQCIEGIHTCEHIDVGHNVAGTASVIEANHLISLKVHEMLYSDPERYLFNAVPNHLVTEAFADEDDDPEREARFKEAKEAEEQAQSRLDVARDAVVSANPDLAAITAKLDSHCAARYEAERDRKKARRHLALSWNTPQEATAKAACHLANEKYVNAVNAESEFCSVEYDAIHERLSTTTAEGVAEATALAERKELLRTAWEAEGAAREARYANRERRMRAADLVDPADRVRFTDGHNAAPCVVCGKGHSGEDWSLAALVDAAWKA